MARMINVQSEVKRNIAQVVRYNVTTKTVETVTVSTPVLFKTEYTKEALKEAHKYDHAICEVLKAETVARLYGMTEERFMKLAVEIPDDKRRNLVTRTMKGETYTVTYLDITKGGTVENMTVTIDVAIPKSMTDKKEAVKMDFVRKQVENGKCAILSIVPGEGYEILYGVHPVTFMANAVELDRKSRKPLYPEAVESAMNAPVSVPYKLKVVKGEVHIIDTFKGEETTESDETETVQDSSENTVNSVQES